MTFLTDLWNPSFWTPFWNWFGRIDNFLGVATTIFAGYAAYRLHQQNKRLRELTAQTPKIEGFRQLVEAYEGKKTSHPVAFGLSLVTGTRSLAPSISTFLTHQGWEMHIEELNMEGLDPQNNLEEFLNQLRTKRRLFEEEKYTEVHLFIQGPIIAGILLGAVFDNWVVPVKLYHKPQNPIPQVYEYWLPLTK